jgi:hypothetical protein
MITKEQINEWIVYKNNLTEEKYLEDLKLERQRAQLSIKCTECKEHENCIAVVHLCSACDYMMREQIKKKAQDEKEKELYNKINTTIRRHLNLHEDNTEEEIVYNNCVIDNVLKELRNHKDKPQ